MEDEWSSDRREDPAAALRCEDAELRRWRRADDVRRLLDRRTDLRGVSSVVDHLATYVELAL